MKTLTILHTTPVIVKLIGEIAAETLPEDVAVRNVVDDSLLNDTRKAGQMTKDVARRLVAYIQLAENYGSDCVLLSCSSVSPAVDIARQVVSIPVIKIDDAMAEEAVRLGRRIAVLATVPTTLRPTRDLIEEAGLKARKEVRVETFLCREAFDALAAGDAQKHNDLLRDKVISACRGFDIAVLAQASMTNILPALPEDVQKRVLTSPRLGLLRVAEVLAPRNGKVETI